MKQVLLLSALSSFAILSRAQKALVKGVLEHKDKGKPLAETELRIPWLKMMTISNGAGQFTFSQVPYGTYKLVINTAAHKKDSVQINVNRDVVDLGVLTFDADEEAIAAAGSQAPIISLDENAPSLNEDGGTDQSVSGVLTASRDPYLSAASFTFGSQRYQLRGYKRDQLEVYLNGLPMNDAESGMAFFGQWGGLNDVFRNQVFTFGLAPSEAGFGGLSGATQIEATAADQRKQTRISYAISNRTYRHRFMITHSSGLNEKGWAYSLSASKRWAGEGYIPGTFYEGYSAYLAISKKISNANSIHLAVFGAPTSRGKAMPATQEAMDLAGSNFYNPNWGYINGKKKNARINNAIQPVVILTFRHSPDHYTQWNTSLGFQTGYNGNTALDWYNAMDPRPDYYRNLPSYYIYDPQGVDEAMANAQRDYLLADPEHRMQVNWQRLYDANRMNVQTVNGVSGRRSVYLIGEDRDDIRKYMLNTTLQKVVGEHVKITGGIAGILQKTESYRKVYDLLGGDYYVNLNQFAERTYAGNNDYNQNDLNHPNGIVYKGDKYSYDYQSDFMRAYAWAQGELNYNKVDFFLAGRMGMEGFRRTGIFKNGLFAGDSEGKSERFQFLTYAVKGGLTYKINGRNYLFAHAALMTNAPTFDNTFVSPRTRNKTVDHAVVEKISSIEGGYLLRSPFLNGRLSGFVTDIKEGAEIKRFYHEDYRTFVNYVLQGLNMRNLGGELALKAKLSPSFSATAVATWMQAFYTSRPKASVYLDNDTSTKVTTQTVYLKDYYVAAGPQSAYTVGVNYSSPQYWYASLNVNFFDRNYIDVNPARLTSDAIAFVSKGSGQWHDILDQEKLPAYYTIDLFCGTSIRLKKYLKSAGNDLYVYLNVGVNNLLNNKNIRTGGLEQLRFDMATQNVNRFPARYFYGYGANYFVNLSFKF